MVSCHGLSYDGSLSIDDNSSSRKLIQNPNNTLESACPNGRFLAFDDRFSSLTFDRMILWVFNCKSFVHTSQIMLKYFEGHFHYWCLLSYLLTIIIIDRSSSGFYDVRFRHNQSHGQIRTSLRSENQDPGSSFHHSGYEEFYYS